MEMLASREASSSVVVGVGMTMERLLSLPSQLWLSEKTKKLYFSLFGAAPILLTIFPLNVPTHDISTQSPIFSIV